MTSIDPEPPEAPSAGYRPAAHERPAVTVDIAVFTLLEGQLQVLLVQRDGHPFKGRWALPGGFVRVGDAVHDQGEDLGQAAERELAEETGLTEGSVYLEQLYTFGRAYRDPRMRVFTVAYFALVSPELAPRVRAGSDAAAASWHRVSELPRLALAFDHDDILDVALQRLRGKLDYSDIAFELVPEHFTTAELRAVHEAIAGRRLDPGNFRRSFNRLVERGLVETMPQKRATSARPAQVYRFVRRR